MLLSFNSGNHEWKKLILTQHWPPTVCKEGNSCQDSLDYWTIHGLWPDKGEECNRSWHFNLDEIKDLLRDMKIYWPDVLHPHSNRSQFCIMFEKEHGPLQNFFLFVFSVLLKFGIKPSINYYNISDFKDVLTRFYGVVPKIQCLLPEKGEEVQTIGQIELCFTKEDLHLRNCTEPGGQQSHKWDVRQAEGAAAQGMVVCDDGPIFYPPPTRTPH
ncbi:PREDICTED: ribonuclease T2 [Dipodomys ordii]|uniref:Ribonuclease T2 n=1 Tax=Dipodomys ordii TaxID=10020 RepID=A0A1S3FVW0_DIPOR|nr:PREDICTED: ribonuclease T2 [Dipodomys ordii]